MSGLTPDEMRANFVAALLRERDEALTALAAAEERERALRERFRPGGDFEVCAEDCTHAECEVGRMVLDFTDPRTKAGA